MKNKYLIPNLNQTEEARELKSEIPSWEDFARNYNYDENITKSYVAEWEEWAIMNGYGPGWGEWISKFAITTAVGIILGPAAIPAGAAVWGASAGLEKLAESRGDEEVKKVFGFISDCGRDVFIGGAAGATVGRLVEAGGASLGSSAVKGVSSSVSKTTDRVVGKIAGEIAAREIAKGGTKETCVAIAREITKKAAKNSGRIVSEIGKEIGASLANLTYQLIELGFTAKEAAEHISHIKKGIEYKKGCSVCES